MPEPRRVLITGASGLVGQQLSTALVAAGHRVLGVDRRGTTGPALAGYEFLQGELSEPGFCSGLFEGRSLDTLIHLAAIVHVRDAKLGFAEYAEANFRTTERLASLASAAGVARFIFASTIEIYGVTTGTAAIAEDHPCRPESDYARTKLLAEQAVAAAFGGPGRSYANLRFAPVYSRDFRLNVDKRLYLKPPRLAYQFGSGNYELHFCSLKNISHFVRSSLAAEQAPSGAFNLADPEPIAARELLLLERAHGRAAIRVPLLRLPARAALTALELGKSLRGKSAGAMSPANLDKLLRSTRWDISRATAAVGPLPGNLAKDLY